MSYLRENLLKLNWSEIESRIVSRIREYVNKAGLKNVIIELKGDLETAIALILLCKVLAPENIYILMLPDKSTPTTYITNSYEIAKTLNIPYDNIEVLYIDPFIRLLKEVLSISDRIQLYKALIRVKDMILAQKADEYNAMIVYSYSKSDLLLRPYIPVSCIEKLCILPLGNLYKIQLREFSRHLGITLKKYEEPFSRYEYTLTDEFKLRYEDIDTILYLLFDLKISIEEIIERFGYDREIIEGILYRYNGIILMMNSDD